MLCFNVAPYCWCSLSAVKKHISQSRERHSPSFHHSQTRTALRMVTNNCQKAKPSSGSQRKSTSCPAWVTWTHDKGRTASQRRRTKVKAKKPLKDLAQKYNKPKRPMSAHCCPAGHTGSILFRNYQIANYFLIAFVFLRWSKGVV